jgi:hypothetical protein
VRPGFAALETYLARQDEDGAVRIARRWFAGLWLVYDLIDSLAGGIEHAREWMPHPPSLTLAVVHAVLLACGVQLVRDRSPFVYGLISAGARLVETSQYGLNDFYYYALLMLLMAHGDGGPFETGKKPLWVRHALLAQLAWIYFATAVLKLNADWLGGGQLLARTEYLVLGFDWPFPSFVRHALQSTRFCAVLSSMAVGAELLLAFVLAARRPYWLGVLLVTGIHGFAMVMTNVWFFSVSNIVAVTLLLPRRSLPVPVTGRGISSRESAARLPQECESGERLHGSTERRHKRVERRQQ